MSGDVWGNLLATLLGFAFAAAWLVLRVKGKRRPAGYCGVAAVILLWPIKLWFWQFELTERDLPNWYIYNAVIQIVTGIGALVWGCFIRFRPVVTALAVAYVFSLILQLFSYMYWSYGTTRDFSVNMSHLDSFYFALGTLTTAGTGNISAISETTRGLQTLQMSLDFILIGFVVVLILTRYSNLLDRPLTPAYNSAIIAMAERILEINKVPAEPGNATSQPSPAVTELGTASQPSAPDTPAADSDSKSEP